MNQPTVDSEQASLRREEKGGWCTREERERKRGMGQRVEDDGGHGRSEEEKEGNKGVKVLE